MNDSERVNGVEVFRLRSQDRPVNFFRRVELPALMQAEGVLKLGLWIVHGLTGQLDGKARGALFLLRPLPHGDVGRFQVAGKSFGIE